ncbi:methyltransferase domain-containing protein [Candidatus Peregrinibacteria bacterium]|nr:methyltransferase domain-containing protein [Candidatus Peregrinibacteria bacterium]
MIEFQRLLMGDKVRNEAFARALKNVIVPGKSVVCDIGSGTGFLSFLASKLGAKHCYLYEVSDLLKLSKKIAQENGITNCTFVQKHSTEVKSPPEADIVLAEMLGNHALEENIIETLGDAKRFLKPGGVMIPQALTQVIAPVMSSRLWMEINVWDDIGFALSFSAAKRATLENVYVRDIEKEDFPGNAVKPLDHIKFLEENASVRDANVSWDSLAGPVYGFALWWDALLVPGITLSTSPLSAPTHWKQIFLPALMPLTLQSGDHLELSVHSDSRYHVKINLVWKITQRRGKKVVAEQEMDMRRGQID